MIWADAGASGVEHGPRTGSAVFEPVECAEERVYRRLRAAEELARALALFLIADLGLI